MLRTISIALFFTLVSCSNKKNETAVELGQQGSGLVADTCLCSDLTIDSLGNLLKDAKPFTGVCYSTYPNSDKKYMIKSLMNGELHGKTVYLGQDGEVLMQELYESGQTKRSGELERLTCDCKELKPNQTKNHAGEVVNIVELDNIPYTGKCRSNYPESHQIYLERNYKSGLLDGYSIYYDKQGLTMYMEKYEAGNLVKTIYETNS